MPRISRLILNEVKLKGRIYLLIITVCLCSLTFYFFRSNSPLLSALESLISIGPSSYSIPFTSSTAKFHIIWFPKFLFIASSIITGLSFSEYQYKSQSNFHISLPASQFEKWIAKVIISVLIIPIFLVFTYQIYALISYKWNYTQVKLHLTDPYLWKVFLQIIFIQCGIFLTAVIYKKYSILKSIIVLTTLYLCYNFIQLISFRIVRDDIDLFASGSIPGMSSLKELLDNAGYQIIGDGPPWLVFTNELSTVTILMITGFISLFLSYIKFTEIES